MKPNELSIGDYIYYNNDGKLELIKIKELRKEAVVDDNGVFYSYDKLEPVPLTDEIMSANGFVESKTIKKWWCKNIDKQRVSIYLHEFEGNFFAFDYWIERPWGDNTQTKFCSIWRDLVDGFAIAQKKLLCPSAGCIHGVHHLQHAYTWAEIEEEIIIPNAKKSETEN